MIIENFLEFLKKNPKKHDKIRKAIDSLREEGVFDHLRQVADEILIVEPINPNTVFIAHGKQIGMVHMINLVDELVTPQVDRKRNSLKADYGVTSGNLK